VAERFKGCVRGGDTLVRLGGDEFIILLPLLGDTEMLAGKQVSVVAHKILQVCQTPIDIQGHTLSVTCSVGALVDLQDLYDLDRLLKHADTAMYRAKALGRSCVQFFQPHMQEAVTVRLELEQALTVALEHNEFELHYQPQVNAQGVLLSAEALIRWRRDGHGMVSPLDFIPVAEETGLIVSIGEWVIRTACEFICELDRGGDLLTPISVNVSARQFRHADFIKTLQSIIQQTGVDPQRLGIELTESLLVEDVAQVTEIMTHVRALGIKVSIDDFGTGYSALSYLKDLPIDVLKVDRAFVRDIHKDKNCAAIAEAILAMAKNLGMGVVAEGVEVAEELEFLMARGCDVFQGFFFSRPLSVEQFKAYGQNQGQYQPVFRAEMLGDEAVR
jgi:EAL domain-containing protein (putative c-di-GMP-specific phosphodiesterase class I)